MSRWREEDLGKLDAILQRIDEELKPLRGKDILVLCCGAGQVALRLAKKMAGSGQVVGLDLSDDLLERARRKAKAEGLEGVVQFQKAEKHCLPFPDRTFDALVSEFIVYPAPLITEIGQPEMARVLKPGGKMILTDVIITKPLTEKSRDALKAIGLDYLCEATPDDFREWMQNAGLVNIEVLDFTPLLRKVWERRRERDASPGREAGYFTLLEDPALRLGEAIFYIYVQGEKEVAL
jgi:ubiquinone/menaquinone biosynthesis C-methylase UbiE